MAFHGALLLVLLSSPLALCSSARHFQPQPQPVFNQPPQFPGGNRYQQATPVDCQFEFGPFGPCSASCGGGVQSRTAFIVQEAQNGGRPCPYQLPSEERPCNQDVQCNPPQDCIWEFGPFGPCSATCGGGVQSRTAFIVQNAAFGGRPCPYTLPTEQRPCNQDVQCNPPQDCIWEFGPFSQCSASCGGGTQSRQGVIVQEAAFGGRPCPYTLPSEDQACNTQACYQPYQPPQQQPPQPSYGQQAPAFQSQPVQRQPVFQSQPQQQPSNQGSFGGYSGK